MIIFHLLKNINLSVKLIINEHNFYLYYKTTLNKSIQRYLMSIYYSIFININQIYLMTYQKLILRHFAFEAHFKASKAGYDPFPGKQNDQHD